MSLLFRNQDETEKNQKWLIKNFYFSIKNMNSLTCTPASWESVFLFVFITLFFLLVACIYKQYFFDTLRNQNFKQKISTIYYPKEIKVHHNSMVSVQNHRFSPGSFNLKKDVPTSFDKVIIITGRLSSKNILVN